MTSGRASQRGQATVELAVVLPVVLTITLLVVQVGILGRDRLVTIHLARSAARIAAVEPTRGAVLDALHRQGAPLERAAVELGGGSAPGEVVLVTVRVSPRKLPVVGRVLGDRVLSETMGALVEGPPG